MSGFFLMVAVAIILSLVKKARDKATTRARNGAPWSPVQNGEQRAQQGAATPPVPDQPHPGFQQYATGQQYAVPQYSPTPGQYPQPGAYAPHYTDPSQLPRQRIPTRRADLDTRVRELMAAGSEVAAVRLLCDEADMGIIEAQEYARSLVRPPGQDRPSRRTDGDGAAGGTDAEDRYVGSAAFATSTFDIEDDDVWASGWKDTAEPDDRSDLDELWQTVRGAGRPKQPGQADNSAFTSEIELT